MTSISDHFPQFLIIPVEISHLPRKHNLYKRNTKNFDKVNFVAEIVNINWLTILSIEKIDLNYSFGVFDLTLNKIMDKYFPLTKITKKEFKQQCKPWLTIGSRKKSLNSNVNHG